MNKINMYTIINKTFSEWNDLLWNKFDKFNISFTMYKIDMYTYKYCMYIIIYVLIIYT